MYTYKGTSRAVSFNLKVAAMSRHEMYPMWEKLNYLVGLDMVVMQKQEQMVICTSKSRYVSTITMLTLGDYLLTNQDISKTFQSR